jgi:large subunit GTPase 1
VFYSAANIATIQDVRRIAEELSRSGSVSHRNGVDEQAGQADVAPRHGSNHFVQNDPGDEGSDDEYSENGKEDRNQDPRSQILSATELELMFVKNAPDLAGTYMLYYRSNLLLSLSKEFLDSSGNAPSKVIVGLVGYPNVGKSSTINSLLGEKKVSVSSTPGKTKHFQTIELSDSIMLCDCPGLVFPQFASTKADLVCDGVLPIDQLREHTGPVTLVTNRLPKEILEATYGLTIRTVGIEEGGDDSVNSEGLLVAYASKSSSITRNDTLIFP